MHDFAIEDFKKIQLGTPEYTPRLSESELEVHEALSAHDWSYISWYRECMLCGRVEWLHPETKEWCVEDSKWIRSIVNVKRNEQNS